MTPYTMPTEAQDRKFQSVADHSAAIFGVLRALPADERMVVEIWRRGDGSLASSCTSTGRRMWARSVEVGTYNRNIDADALRGDIEFAVRQL